MQESRQTVMVLFKQNFSIISQFLCYFMIKLILLTFYKSFPLLKFETFFFLDSLWHDGSTDSAESLEMLWHRA